MTRNAALALGGLALAVVLAVGAVVLMLGRDGSAVDDVARAHLLAETGRSAEEVEIVLGELDVERDTAVVPYRVTLLPEGTVSSGELDLTLERGSWRVVGDRPDQTGP